MTAFQMTPEKLETLLQMHDDGHNAAEIAEVIGCQPSTLTRHIRKRTAQLAHNLRPDTRLPEYRGRSYDGVSR